MSPRSSTRRSTRSDRSPKDIAKALYTKLVVQCDRQGVYVNLAFLREVLVYRLVL